MDSYRKQLVSEGLCTIAEACQFLGIKRAKLYDLMGQGRLAYCKVGAARRIPRRALAELAEEMLIVKGS